MFTTGLLAAKLFPFQSMQFFFIQIFNNLISFVVCPVPSFIQKLMPVTFVTKQQKCKRCLKKEVPLEKNLTICIMATN